MKRLFAPICLFCLLVLVSCGKEPEINENVSRILDVMMNVPNDEIFGYVEMGNGVTGQPDMAKAEERAAKLRELTEDCIAENYYDSFWNNSPDPGRLAMEAMMLDVQVSLAGAELKEETEEGQTVTVTLRVNDETDITAEVFFELDEGGLVKNMTYITPPDLSAALE